MKPAAIAVLLLAMFADGWAQTPLKLRTEQKQGRRLALLVGNQSYSKLHSSLPGTSQALEMIQPALFSAGFTITLVRDANYADLKTALDKFVADVREDDVCFFYYSGYAVQNESEDDDYLLPADFDPSTESINNRVAYPVSALAINLQTKKAGVKMFFLEGDRNFDSNLTNAAPGLRIPNTNQVTELLFAIPNPANQTVEMAPAQPGLFTNALVAVIDSEKPLAELMPYVLKTVKEQSRDSKKPQQPASDSSVDEVFYFHPPHVRSQNQTDREWYVWVRAGRFMMGCVPGVKCEADEEPRHEVTLTKGFWMGENEVRVTSYKNFTTWNKKNHKTPDKMPGATEENPKWRDEEHPIANMTWNDAKGYCSWAGGRLPTEAEWEWAARGGQENRVYPFDSFDESKKKAMFYGNDYYKYTAPVQKFDKNEFGLFDMSGNVWELVSDYFAKYPESPVVDPNGPATGKHHVQRGGSYDSDPKTHLRISFREPSKEPWPNIGFRCVMDDTPQSQQILQRFRDQVF